LHHLPRLTSDTEMQALPKAADTLNIIPPGDDHTGTYSLSSLPAGALAAVARAATLWARSECQSQGRNGGRIDRFGVTD